MTHKEKVERNIGLTFDFVKHLINNPDELDKLPDEFTLEFVEKDFPNKHHAQYNNQPSLKTQSFRVENAFIPA